MANWLISPGIKCTNVVVERSSQWPWPRIITGRTNHLMTSVLRRNDITFSSQLRKNKSTNISIFTQVIFFLITKQHTFFFECNSKTERREYIILECSTHAYTTQGFIYYWTINMSAQQYYALTFKYKILLSY